MQNLHFVKSALYQNVYMQRIERKNVSDRTITKAIKENMSIDWNLRDSARAKMRITVRRLLKKYGYPPDLQKLAVDTVVKQAELMAGGME